MKKSITCLDKVVILCRNVEQSASIYCQILGLKVVLQSHELVELRDANNQKIYLKSTNRPYQLSKGYTPILSFKVQYFDQVKDKLLSANLIPDGDVVTTNRGQIASFLGPEGEHISINNLVEEQEEQPLPREGLIEEEDKASQQIRNLLNKIKL